MGLEERYVGVRSGHFAKILEELKIQRRSLRGVILQDFGNLLLPPYYHYYYYF